MKLYSASPSIMFTDNTDVSIEVPDSQPVYPFHELSWNNEISVDEAVIKLEKTLYPFKEVSIILIYTSGYIHLYYIYTV